MIRRVFLAFLVFGLVACGDSPTEPEDVPGTYHLQTVNGRSLPFSPVLFTSITAWSITLNQDMTCSETVGLKRTEFVFSSGESTKTDVCTYTFDDGAITLTFSASGKILTGSMSGSSLTISDDGDVFVFRK